MARVMAHAYQSADCRRIRMMSFGEYFLYLKENENQKHLLFFISNSAVSKSKVKGNRTKIDKAITDNGSDKVDRVYCRGR